MHSTDKIAILMATYNGEKYICQQIDSILSQTCKDWELYIHDDGSTDNTRAAVESYVEKYQDKIHLIDGKSTGGAKYNFFYLFGQVEAPYYMTCDQDDVWLDKKIELTYDKMLTIENKADVPCLVYTELRVVDRELNTIADTMSGYQSLDCHKRTINQFILQNSVTGCTMMVNRTLRDKMLRITDIDNTIMHDWWAALVAAQFGKTAFIDEPTILYRQHGDNSLGALGINKLSYIVRRVWQKKQIQESMRLGRLQAREFAKTYNLPADSLAVRYAALEDKSRCERQRFYKENDMYKTGTMRRLGQAVWG
jgi:glycosyltransferase involved in cell wall biosynthesis